MTDLTAQLSGNAETDTALAIEALRESEARFRATFEQAAVGIAHVGLAGQWLRVNRKLCEIVGYSPEELTQKTFQDITHEPDLAQDLEHVRQLLAGECQTYAMEKRYIHAQGHLIWIKLTASLVRDQAQSPQYFIAVIEDIEARKQAELSLRQSEARLQRAITDAPFPILLCSDDGQILQISQALTRIAGYERSEIPTLETWVERAYPEEIRADVLANIYRLFDLTEPKEEGEFAILTRTGEQRIWRFATSPLGRSSDGCRLLLSLASDVTQLKQAQSELSRFNQDLEDKIQVRTEELESINAELKAFTSTVSHDLRAPLRAMQGFAQALLEDYEPVLDDLGHEYAERIVQAATQMSGLIADLLEYSHLARSNIQTETLCLDSLVSGLWNDLSDLAEGKFSSRAASLQVTSALPVVRGNRRVLKQVLYNLLENGLKFVPPERSPQLTLWAEPAAPPPKPVAGALPKIRLWVQDNGIGIAPQHRDRIFKVFERLHGIESYPGTGIGLAIVKRGIERLGGRVGLESTLGEGSRFWIELPWVCDGAD